MDQQKHEVQAVEKLLAATLDSADGYAQAARSARKSHLSDLFHRRAAERAELVEQMQARVRALGGHPQESGTLLASFQRTFLRLSQILGSDDHAVLAEVEHCEERLQALYEEALKDDELSVQGREIVQRAYGSALAGLYEARQLRDKSGSKR